MLQYDAYESMRGEPTVRSEKMSQKAKGLIGLILFVFAELFRQATKYKEENDMTI